MDLREHYDEMTRSEEATPWEFYSTADFDQTVDPTLRRRRPDPSEIAPRVFAKVKAFLGDTFTMAEALHGLDMRAPFAEAETVMAFVALVEAHGVVAPSPKPVQKQRKPRVFAGRYPQMARPTRPGQHTWTREQIELVFRSFEAGVKVPVIAAGLGLREKQVHGALENERRRRGLARTRTAGGCLEVYEVAEIVALTAAGVGIAEVSRILGKPRTTCFRARKKAFDI